MMNKEMILEMKKRSNFLTEELEKRKKKVSLEILQLEKIWLEILELQKKINSNAE